MSAAEADPRTRHIPVVAVTGLTPAVVLRRAREVGCVDVLFKPCDPDTLLAAIRRLLFGGEWESREAKHVDATQHDDRMRSRGRRSSGGSSGRHRG